MNAACEKSYDSHEKTRVCQLITLENILHLLLCERKCITEVKLDLLPGIVDLKKKQFLLFHKICTIQNIDEIAEKVQKIRITDLEVKNSDHISCDKLKIKEGIKLAIEMNAANARLYSSVLSFAAKCRNLLWKNVNAGATYTNKGTFQKVSGSLRVNLKA